MNLKISLFPLVCICLLLSSATTIKVHPKPVSHKEEVIMQTPLSINTPTENKLNFFQRLTLKMALKKFQPANPTKADEQANTSLMIGIAACAFLVLGLIVPLIVLLSIPAGIIAMIMGRSALRAGTEKVSNAKTGKILGLAALIAFGVLLIAALIFIAAWGGAFG
jgi:hypothetical protein